MVIEPSHGTVNECRYEAGDFAEETARDTADCEPEVNWKAVINAFYCGIETPTLTEISNLKCDAFKQTAHERDINSPLRHSNQVKF